MEKPYQAYREEKLEKVSSEFHLPLDNYELRRLQEELNRDKKRWSVSRKLAVGAFIINSIIMFTYFILATDFIGNSSYEVLKEFNSIAITIIGSNSTVILAYIGASTINKKLM